MASYNEYFETETMTTPASPVKNTNPDIMVSPPQQRKSSNTAPNTPMGRTQTLDSSNKNYYYF